MRLKLAGLALTLLVGLLSPRPASAADQAWRPLLPSGWLAVASTGDLDRAEEKLAGLLGELSFEYSSVTAALKQAAGADELQLAGGDFVLGYARQAETEAEYAFALVPAQDFVELVTTLGGEITGDVGVVTLFGVDLCLAPYGVWTMVAPLDQLDVVRAAMPRPVEAAGEREAADLAIELSPAGIAYLGERAARADWRTRLMNLRRTADWPPTLAGIDAAVLQNVPLIDAWSELMNGVRLTLTVEGDDYLAWRLTAPLRALESAPPRADRLAAPRLPIESPIARLTGSGRGSTAELLTRLCLAYSLGRPDEIDARSYPPAAYASFVEATAAAIKHVRGYDALSRESPTGAEPLMANEAVLVEVDDRAAFEEAVANSIRHWNGVVATSDARMPIAFDTRRVEHSGRPVLEFRVDMVEAIDVSRSPEITSLMQRLFGPGGFYSWRLIPVGENRVLLADLPVDEALALAEASESQVAGVATPKGDRWSLEVSLDRLIAWHGHLYRVTNADVIGRRDPKPMPEAPAIVIEATAAGRRLQLEARVPRDTVRAIGRYLRASRR